MEKLSKLKLQLLYHGIKINKECRDRMFTLNGEIITFNDCVTTSGLILNLGNDIYATCRINEDSPYIVGIEGEKYTIHSNFVNINNVYVLQPSRYILDKMTNNDGELLSNFVNVHGDRARIQPIGGCANDCVFCDIHEIKYVCKSVDKLDEALKIAMNYSDIKHALISGGSPRNNQDDFDYLTNVYKYFGTQYNLPIDIMLVPRGFKVGKNNKSDYIEYLKLLKSFNIAGLSINLEFYNNLIREKYIPFKNRVSKEQYYLFIEEAVNIFGVGNVRSCLIIGLESKDDTLNAVEDLSKRGCMPVLSPLVPYNVQYDRPTPEYMEEILEMSEEIVKKYEMELGPKCNMCKHNTINF